MAGFVVSSSAKCVRVGGGKAMEGEPGAADVREFGVRVRGVHRVDGTAAPLLRPLWLARRDCRRTPRLRWRFHPRSPSP